MNRTTRRATEGVRVRRAPRMLARYLIAGLLLVLMTVGATVWLARTSEYRYDEQASEIAFARDLQVRDALVRWAGQHPDWDSAGPELLRLGHETGRRIALVGGDGRVIADTAPELPRPERSTSLLDPLETFADPDTLESRLPDGIVGPFLLDATERDRSAREAAAVSECLGDALVDTAVWDSGRAVVAGHEDAPDCGRTALDMPLERERAALDELRDRTNACLLARGSPTVEGVELDLSPSRAPDQLAVRTVPAAGDAADACLLDARRTQAAATTAPAVDVVLTDERGGVRGPLDASPGSIARIAVVGLVLLALLVAAAALIVVPTLRSARRLEAAADRFAAGGRDGRVGLRPGDDLAPVGAAFDRMSAEIADHEASRRRLLGDVAHELRSPLTNIRGWVEAADDGIGLDDVELRRLVLSEAHRLERITSDLQLLALAEAGDLTLTLEPCDTATIVQEVAEAHRARATSSGISLDIAVPGPLRVQADPARLRQVLDNLVANALRHTPAGGQVTIGATALDGDVRITVEDTGEGIAPEDLPRVFDRLWRGDPARARAGQSSGLGLSIARGLVEAQGGTITARSALGRGSRFDVRLPGFSA
ncbi:sensor histidine kinase [Clavibacter sp. Sh2088]|uniref:sensor histidine kinase n=1 Tax=Clavibacter sp. Sh2088 TaxID=3397676 RepID=UPI0039DFBCCD